MVTRPGWSRASPHGSAAGRRGRRATSLPGVNGGEHLQRLLVHRWERHAEAGESERRLDQSPPRPSEPLPEVAESGRQARDCARDAGLSEQTTTSSPNATGTSTSSPSPEGTAAKPSRFDTREPSNAMAWQPARSPLITVSATQEARHTPMTASAGASRCRRGSPRLPRRPPDVRRLRAHPRSVAEPPPGGAPSWRSSVSRSLRAARRPRTLARRSRPRTGPKSLLSRENERLSPSTKYWSAPTSTRGNGAVVMSSILKPLT